MTAEPLTTVQQTIAAHLAYDPERDPNYRHICRRCGQVFRDMSTAGLCAEMGGFFAGRFGALPLPFVQRRCGGCHRA